MKITARAVMFEVLSLQKNKSVKSLLVNNHNQKCTRQNKHQGHKVIADCFTTMNFNFSLIWKCDRKKK